MMKVNLLGGLTLAAMISACATPGMLPQSEKEIDYSAVGYVKGSGWHDGAIYEASEADVVASINAALVGNGLKIHEYTPQERKFIAESPWNMHRWVNYVSVYYRPIGDKKIEVHIVSLSTKDINALADDSETPLPPRLVASITSNLSRRNR